MNGRTRWWASPPPSVGLEIASNHVTAVSLKWSRQGPVVAAHAAESVPDGALVPSLTADNVVDRTAVAGAVRRVLGELGSPRRVAMVIPDAAAKVSMVKFEKVPSRAADLEQMIRWQVRKAVPFPIEAAQVAFARSDIADAIGEYVVVVLRRDVVESYEALAHAAGAHAGLVDLASFSVVNAVLAADKKAGVVSADDWLLVHLTVQSSTLAIIRSGRLVFYRNRLGDAQEPLVDLVHQTAMYYEDRLGGRGFGRVVLSAGADALALEQGDVRQTLTERLRSPVEPVDPRGAASLADRIGASDDRLASVVAPVGALLREVA